MTIKILIHYLCIYLNPHLSTSPFHSLSLSHPSFCFHCQWMVMVFLIPMLPQQSLLTLVPHPLMSPSSSFSFFHSPLSHDKPSPQTLHSLLLSFSHAITIFIFFCIFPLHGFQVNGLNHSPLIPFVLVCFPSLLL